MRRKGERCKFGAWLNFSRLSMARTKRTVSGDAPRQTLLPLTVGYGRNRRKTPHAQDPLANRTDIQRVGYHNVVYDVEQPYHTFFVDVPRETPLAGSNVVRARRFCRLFSPKLANFLINNPSRFLTMDDAALWGFSEEEADEARSDGRTAEAVEVRRVAFSGRGAEGPAGPNCIRGGEPFVFYGSVHWTGPLDVTMDITNRDREWFAVYFHTLDCRKRKRRQRVAFEEVEEAIVVESVNRENSLATTFDWLIANPRQVVVLKSAQARPPSRAVTSYHNVTHRVPFRARDAHSGDCLWLALLNAGALLGMTKAGPEAIELAEEHLVAVETMAGLASFVTKNWPSLSLERIKCGEGDQRHAARSNEFSPTVVTWLPPGVYLVRLIGSVPGAPDRDHMVVVDTMDMLIWDCVEPHPMQLCAGALECCVGDGATLVDVQEIRHLVSIGRKRKTSNRERKRQRRRLASAAVDK